MLYLVLLKSKEINLNQNKIKSLLNKNKIIKNSNDKSPIEVFLIFLKKNEKKINLDEQDLNNKLILVDGILKKIMPIFILNYIAYSYEDNYSKRHNTTGVGGPSYDSKDPSPQTVDRKQKDIYLKFSDILKMFIIKRYKSLIYKKMKNI